MKENEEVMPAKKQFVFFLLFFCSIIWLFEIFVDSKLQCPEQRLN